MPLELTALQLPGIDNYVIAAHERFEYHRGQSASSHLRLELLLSSSVSCFVDAPAHLVKDKVPPHHFRLTGVISSAPD